MTELLKWQQKYVSLVSSFSNEDLLYETLEACHGDSWDGCFTNRGYWCFDYLTKELRIRLEKMGFLET